MAMAATACNKLAPAEPEPAATDNRQITVCASIPSTKLAIDSGQASWTAGDAIAVYNTEGTMFTLTLSEGAGTNYGKFSGSFSGTLVTDYAIYPAAYAGTVPGHVNIPKYEPRTDNVNSVMASALTVNGTDIEATGFHHLMAVVEITLKNLPAYACALKFWSKEGAQLNGDYTINPALDGVSYNIGSKEEGTYDHIIYFPYKTEGEIKFCVPVPAYDYTDLAVRVLDGDEDVIEGTGKNIPAKFSSFKAGDYVAMPALDVRSLVGTARDNFVKIEGVKWAKGNLRAWEQGTDGSGWQRGWNIYDNQWESQYMLKAEGALVNGDNQSFSLSDDLFKGTEVDYGHWDYFSWGTLSRSSRVHNCAVTSTVPNFEISGKVFKFKEDAIKGDISVSADEVFGDERWGDIGTFQSTNSNLVGDVAFWASKGQYRMPTKGEINKLYAKNAVGEGSEHAHLQAGYYMVGEKKVNGILFTSCPSWETTTYETTAIEITDKDLECGLFLPKAGERTTNKENSYNSGSIKYFNSWGAYWSGTYGGMNEGFEDCAVHIFFTSANAMNYGYTSSPSKTISGKTIIGNCIRPVWIPENER